MTVSNQVELANLIDLYFKHGSLGINDFIFKQFDSVNSDERKKLLDRLYADKFTANYSFESKEKSASEIIGFFVTASPEKQKAHFMVFDKNNNFLGRCNLRVVDGEIYFGITLQPCLQARKGYGKAILKALFKLCFDVLKLEQNIYGSTMSYNIKSQKTMQKTGMVPDGVKESIYFNLALDTKWLKYTITPAQFLANNISEVAHEGSRRFIDVIREDCKQSRKGKGSAAAYSPSQYARALFFMQQERRDFAFKQFQRKVKEEIRKKLSLSPSSRK